MNVSPSNGIDKQPHPLSRCLSWLERNIPYLYLIAAIIGFLAFCCILFPFRIVIGYLDYGYTIAKISTIGVFFYLWLFLFSLVKFDSMTIEKRKEEWLTPRRGTKNLYQYSPMTHYKSKLVACVIAVILSLVNIVMAGIIIMAVEGGSTFTPCEYKYYCAFFLDPPPVPNATIYIPLPMLNGEVIPWVREQSESSYDFVYTEYGEMLEITITEDNDLEFLLFLTRLVTPHDIDFNNPLDNEPLLYPKMNATKTNYYDETCGWIVMEYQTYIYVDFEIPANRRLRLNVKFWGDNNARSGGYFDEITYNYTSGNESERQTGWRLVEGRVVTW